MPFAPLCAQGIGPPDLGVFNYVIIGVWLYCWLAVLIYPIALVVYFIGRQPKAEEEDEYTGTPSFGHTVLKWSIKIHIFLTLAGILLFALD